MSELIALDAVKCFRLPDDVIFEHGASLIMTYGTAYHAQMQCAQVRAGESVLVTGAAGGVGPAAIEVAKVLGARVVAAASSEAKLAVARSHGADATVVHPRGPLDAEGRKALSNAFNAACGAGADVVIASAGKLTEAALRATAWKGRLLVIGFPAGISRLATNLLRLKGASAIGVFLAASPRRSAISIAPTWRRFSSFIARGRFVPTLRSASHWKMGGGDCRDAGKRCLWQDRGGRERTAGQCETGLTAGTSQATIGKFFSKTSFHACRPTDPADDRRERRHDGAGYGNAQAGNDAADG